MVIFGQARAAMTAWTCAHVDGKSTRVSKPSHGPLDGVENTPLRRPSATLEGLSRQTLMIDIPKPLFESRQNLATPAAIQALAEAQVAREDLLRRHFAGDWGDVNPDDWQENDRALDTGSRILSAYVISTGVRVWVMTEAASATGLRSATTILLPTEY